MKACSWMIAMIFVLGSAMARGRAEEVPAPRVNLELTEMPAEAPGLAETATQLEHTGSRERIVGMIVTGVGVASAGFAIWGFSIAAHGPKDSDTELVGNAYGIMGSILAGLHFAVGIPLWIDGNRRIEAARAQRPQVAITAAPGGSIGAGLQVNL